ncbi:hypothetical protein E4T56_gene1578 [Termitomyces sp. T112]|nr:hypothetical protein E4T56_gene1578 [Termitomyces sp. T112]KAH0589202.1 hypothetical protein H2248_004966 [Termitomyces sp. 'cryptogamus']KNZ72205.1 hypothetical protein J132_04326 [Termitomyces sp. J132]
MTPTDEDTLVEPLTHSHSSRPSLNYDVDDEERISELYIPSLEARKRFWWKNAIINSLFIAAWFLFATVLSVYNKWMFSSDHLGFPYPLFVTTIHMFVQFILAATLRLFFPRQFKPANKPTVADYGKKALPTAVASSLDIGLSNVSLKTITLSFYTMCKSSSLIFVLFFAFIFRLEIFSWRLVGVIILIFSGVLLMVATETRFVFEGFILVLSASACGGLRWSLTQLLLRNRKMGLDNPAATIYWLAPSMGVTLAIISVIVDSWSSIFGGPFFVTAGKSLQTIFYVATPGVIAFCMILSEFYIIQRAGVVPMSIAGIAKEVTTITISAWFFGDQLTPLNITGASITICGIILFTYHKYRNSIESKIPLDAHGNPTITEEDLFLDIEGRNGDHIELEEESHGLTSASRVSDDELEDEASSNGRRVLFSATVGEDDREPARNLPSSQDLAVKHGRDM